MFSMHYHELIAKIEEHEGKNSFTVNDYILDEVLGKIKEIIGTEQFGDAKTLTDTLPDYIILENVVIIRTCVIKDNGTLYSQIFLGKIFFAK